MCVKIIVGDIAGNKLIIRHILEWESHEFICYRQKEIFAQEDYSESDPREVEAAAHNLTYIPMDGNIGCLGMSL